MTKFVVFGTQRTGTTLLVSLLDSHAKILCIGEAFHKEGIGRILHSEFSYEKYKRGSVRKRFTHLFNRPAILNRYLDYVYSVSGYEAIGFNLLMYQANSICISVLKEYFRRNSIKIVFTVRKNLLKKYVSLQIARRRGLYGTAKKNLENIKITLQAENIISELDMLYEEDQSLEATLDGLDYIRVKYESLLEEKDSECNRLLSFLGVDKTSRLESSLVKMNSNNLQDIVENYDEVVRELKGSPYEYCIF